MVVERAQLKCRELPATNVASVVHHGLFDAAFGEAYHTILRWIEVNGYRIVGPFREIYLNYAEDDAQESTTEIQFPVEKA
jgi:effector-binding domain-containing protein